MPSARLVFNDDATVLGPVLERTGEMIKAATSDIPRLRLGQEQFAHGRSMDLANLKMRQDAAQAEQDRLLTGDLLGPGAAGVAGGMRLSAGAPIAADRLALAKDKQDEAEYSSRAKRVQQAIEDELKGLPDYSGLVEDPVTREQRKVPLTPDAAKQRMETARHNVGNRFITETDMDPITARVLHDMGFAINVPTQPGRQDSLVDGKLLSFGGGPDASAFDLQRRRAAWLQLKNDPQRAMRMGYDENRMNELYRQLWPDAGAEQVQPVQDAGPDLLTMRAADAAHASRGGQPIGFEPEQQPIEQPPIAQQRGFRTPDDVRIGEHYRANDVDAAIKALVAKASADPDANLEPIQFLVNEQNSSGGMQRTPDLRDLLSLGQLSNLFTTGSVHPGLPEWMGGQRPMPRMTSRVAAQTPQQRIAETLDPLQANATFTNRLSIGQR